MIRTKMNPRKSGDEALAIVDVMNVNRLVFLDTADIEQIVVDGARSLPHSAPA
jgi:hypothetical protein